MRKLKRALISLLVLAVITGTGVYIWFDEENLELNAAQREKLDVSFTELPHGMVHYELSGPESAPLVVLVHGFSIPSYLWDPTVSALTEKGFRVLRFDLYGRGFTDRPETDYTIDLFVEQLQDLTNTLNIDAPFHLVGLSMGGPITTRFTHQNPEQVISLSLLAPLVATPNRTDLNLIKLPLLGEFLANVVIIPKLAKSLPRTVYDPAVYPEFEEKLSEHKHFKGYRRALLSTARHLAGRSFELDYQALGQSRIPVQLIWGKQDPTVPFWQHEIVKELVPQAAVHGLDKTGHLPQIEQADQVNALLEAFFNQTHVKDGVSSLPVLN